MRYINSFQPLVQEKQDSKDTLAFGLASEITCDTENITGFTYSEVFVVSETVARKMRDFLNERLNDENNIP